MNAVHKASTYNMHLFEELCVDFQNFYFVLQNIFIFSQYCFYEYIEGVGNNKQ